MQVRVSRGERVENAARPKIEIRKLPFRIPEDAPKYFWRGEKGVTAFAYALSAVFPDGERSLRQRLQRFPDEASLAALRARDVRWIIADNAWLSGGAGEAAAALPALRVAHRDERQTVFELDPGSR